MPVFPEVPSTMVPPGLRRPSASASSTIFKAMRSLTEFPGLKNSTLANTKASISEVILLSLISGVFPIAPKILSMYCIWQR